MGSFLDALAIDYPLTRNFDGKWTGLLSYTVLLALTVIFAVINVALVGYETVTIFEDKYDAPDPHWYSAFLPSYNSRQSCDPALYRVRDSFWTNSSLFEWQIDAIFNSSSGSTASFAYSGQSLAGCGVFKMDVQYTLTAWTVEAIARVKCTIADNVKVDLKTKTTYVESYDSHQEYWEGVEPTTNNVTKSPGLFATETTILLASYDMIEAQAPWHPFSNGSIIPPTLVRGQIIPPFCPISASQDPACVQDVTNLTISKTAVAYPDLDIYIDRAHLPRSTNVTSIYTPTMLNYAQMLLAAIKIDLGDNRPNVFLNPSLINDTLTTSYVSHEKEMPPRLVSFLWDPSERAPAYPNLLPLSSEFGPSTIKSTYLCRFQRLKSPGSLIVSIFVATSSMVGSSWAVFIFFATWWVKRDPKRNLCKIESDTHSFVHAGHAT